MLGVTAGSDEDLLGGTLAPFVALLRLYISAPTSDILLQQVSATAKEAQVKFRTVVQSSLPGVLS